MKKCFFKDRLITYIAVFIIIGSNIFRFDNLFLLDKLFTFLSLIIVLIVPFGLNIKRKMMPLLCALFFVFGLIIVNTFYHNIINNGSLLIVFLVKIIVVALLLGKYVERAVSVFEIISNIFLVILLLNVLQTLFFPGILGTRDGNNLYLVGSNYNNFGGVYFIGVFASWILAKSDKKYRWLYWGQLFLSFLSVILMGSITSAVAFFIIILYSVLQKSKIVQRLAPLLLIISVIIFLNFVVLKSNVAVLSGMDIINMFLGETGKDITFSGRLYIWDNAMQVIEQNPVLGVGYYQSGEWAELHLSAVNSHNAILDVLIVGGWTLLAFLVFLILKLYIKIYKTIKSEYFWGIVFFSSVFLLMMQFEVYSYFIISLFVLLVYISRFCTKFLKDNNFYISRNNENTCDRGQWFYR